MIQLAVLLPTIKSWPEGRAAAGAVSLAVAEANNLSYFVGRDAHLAFSWREVDCDSSSAPAALGRMLGEGRVDAVIGPDCSTACESTGYITAGLDIPQISYSCSASILSDKSKYPTVSTHALFVFSAPLRLLRSVSSTAGARLNAISDLVQFARTTSSYLNWVQSIVAFVLWAGWTQISLIASREAVFEQTSGVLAQQLPQSGVQLGRAISFEPGSFDANQLDLL
jgi:hypothetical protein